MFDMYDDSLSGGLVVAIVLIVIALIFAFKSINVIPQQTAWVIERLGKFHKVLNPGLNFIIPFIDKFGNNKFEKVLLLSYKTSDLMQINHSSQNFLLQDLLNLTEDVWILKEPTGQELINAFCNDAIASGARIFCKTKAP